MEIIAFAVFLILFASVGLLSRWKASNSEADYLLADREVSPLLTALSAAATKYSGYMFIGLMGYIYTHGLSAIWILFGFLFGDAISFFTIHRKLRKEAQRSGALSFSSLLSRWHGGERKLLKAAIGVISLVFLTTYAAAQFSAGGKALQVMFGWAPQTGAIIGALLITAYCLSGGLRASIWTDAAQSIVMTLALILLLSAAISSVGGFTFFIEKLQSVSPSYLDLGSARFGSLGATVLFALGWVFNGIGVVGQPHIMIRFMALNRWENTTITGVYYFTWSAVFLLLTLAVGLSARLFIVDVGQFDAELALPLLTLHLLPGIAIGVVLGGVFAATMSTADSQILACSAVLSEDFKLGHSNQSRRFVTLAVALVALGISLFASTNVFSLVILAWSALASSIGPIVIVHALGKKPPEMVSLTMMASGLITVILWRQFGLNIAVYEGLPGIVVSLLVYVSATYLMPRSKNS